MSLMPNIHANPSSNSSSDSNPQTKHRSKSPLKSPYLSKFTNFLGGSAALDKDSKSRKQKVGRPQPRNKYEQLYNIANSNNIKGDYVYDTLGHDDESHHLNNARKRNTTRASTRASTYDRTEYLLSSEELSRRKKRKLANLHQRKQKVRELQYEVKQMNGKKCAEANRDAAHSAAAVSIDDGDDQSHMDSEGGSLLDQKMTRSSLAVLEFEYSDELREQMKRLRSTMLLTGNDSWMNETLEKQTLEEKKQQSKMRRVQQKLHRVNTEHNSLQTMNNEMRAYIQHLENEHRALNDNNQQQKQQYNDLKAQYHELGQRLKQLVEEQNRLRTIVKQYSEKHNTSDEQVEYYTKKIASLQDTNHNLHKDLERQETRVKKLNQIRRQQIATIKDLSKEKQKFQSRLKRRSTSVHSEGDNVSISNHEVTTLASEHEIKMQDKMHRLENQVHELRQYNRTQSTSSSVSQKKPSTETEVHSDGSAPTSEESNTMAAQKHQEALEQLRSDMERKHEMEVASLQQQIEASASSNPDMRKLQDMLKIRNHQCQSKDEQISNLKEEIKILTKRDKKRKSMVNASDPAQLVNELSILQHQMESHKKYIEKLKQDSGAKDEEIQELKGANALNIDRIRTLEAELNRRRQLQRKESASGLKVRTIPQNSEFRRDYLDISSPSIQQTAATPDPDMAPHLDSLNLSVLSPRDENQAEDHEEDNEEDEFVRLVKEVKSSPTATTETFAYPTEGEKQPNKSSGLATEEPTKTAVVSSSAYQ